MIAFVLAKRPEQPRCAVVGCTSPGKPHKCPYDGSVHHHGRIHYSCHKYAHFAPHSRLEFVSDDWHLMCGEHFGQIILELHPDSLRRETGAR